MNPELIIASGGQRYAGKDETALCIQRVLKRMGVEAHIIPLSLPLKVEFAEERNLDADRLVNDRPYKEVYREELIKYARNRRAVEPHCFVDGALRLCKTKVLIVPDIRDMEEEKRMFELNAIRILVDASDETRARRGWIYNPVVDEDPTETTVKKIKRWDVVIDNNYASVKELENHCENVVNQCILPRLLEQGLGRNHQCA